MDDLHGLSCVPADHYPLATDYIGNIVKMIQVRGTWEVGGEKERMEGKRMQKQHAFY